jgi:hypothetical protein
VQLDAQTPAAQLPGGGVQLEGSEAVTSGWTSVRHVWWFILADEAPAAKEFERVINSCKSSAQCDLRREEHFHRVRFIALLQQRGIRQFRYMQKLLFATLLCLQVCRSSLIAAPTHAAVSAFDSYCNEVEARLGRQHGSPTAFLAPPTSDTERAEVRLRRGEPVVERLAPSTVTDVSGSMLHHWRGTAFAPGGKAAGFERLLRAVDSYPEYFAPEVLQARVLTQEGYHSQTWMRVRQNHVVTVVMDATYDVSFGRLDSQRGYSVSRSTRIAEIESPGTDAERALNANEEHGYLWRLNTYWSYEERDGGLYLQIEAVSLTRSIPGGLSWVIGPYVESIPRDSLEFTLRAGRAALLKQSRVNGAASKGHKDE